MKIKYDKTIDAKYITIKKGKIVATIKLQDGLFVDQNAKGEIVGIELLNASKNLISVWTDGTNVIGIRDAEFVSKDTLTDEKKPLGFKWNFNSKELIYA